MSETGHERDKTGQSGTKRDKPARRGRDKRGHGDGVPSKRGAPFVPPAGVPTFAAIGNVILVGGMRRRWVCIDEKECVRRDGKPSKIFYWQTSCKTCGLAFEQTTGSYFIGDPPALGVANCGECRKSKP